jgi:hypothetical protein
VPPAPARDLDREMDALVRMDAAEKDQVVAGALVLPGDLPVKLPPLQRDMPPPK